MYLHTSKLQIANTLQKSNNIEHSRHNPLKHSWQKDEYPSWNSNLS